MKLVEGKIVLVTGASRGMGRGIAYELGAQGATVVLTARTMSADQAPVQAWKREPVTRVAESARACSFPDPVL
ncbi:MAG: SDR family NAD(P)-dependent oxidoreductase [Acidobacteria bacterium]|nr:SDR family NAD(P)-dependent oxidoreductase [Acidobacteriota bacterium]